MGAEILPGLAVPTVKANGRKKFRYTACGNFAKRLLGADLSTSNMDANTLRLMTNLAGASQLPLTFGDIRTAFLHAPLRGDRCYGARIPSLYVSSFQQEHVF